MNALAQDTESALRSDIIGSYAAGARSIDEMREALTQRGWRVESCYSHPTNGYDVTAVPADAASVRCRPWA